MAGLYPISNFTLGTSNQKIAVGDRIPLILAQGLGTGSYTTGGLIENISNDLTEIAGLVGEGSIAQRMIEAFRKESDGRLDAIIVDDNGSGVDAEGEVDFTGATPTASGTITVQVGSDTNYSFDLAITTTSTATTIGDDLVTAITASGKSPVTAANVSGVVTLTTKNAGTEGNSIGLKVVGAVDGVTVALTAFASGATDSVLTGILTKIDEKRYDILTEVAFVSDVKTHLEAKFNVSNDILDGVGFVAKTDTYSNAQSALAPATLSSQVIGYFANKLVNDADHKGGALLELDHVISAKMGAFRSLRLTDGAILNSFMVGGNVRGGAFTAGVPYHNMRISNIGTIPTGKGFTQTETLGLADLGGSTLSMDSSGTVAVTNPFWTTAYKGTSSTAIGLTYRTINNNDTSTVAREYIFRNLKNNYAQAALTTGSIPADSKIVIANERAIRAYTVGLWDDLTGGDFTVLQGGVTSDGVDLRDDFNSNLVINIDTATGTVSGSMAFRIMGQLTKFDFNITPNL